MTKTTTTGRGIGAVKATGVFTRDGMLRSFGTNEDGEPILRSNVVVLAETARGERWQHEVEFPTLAAAERFADRVREALRAGRRLDPTRWIEVGACYGSEAYAEDLDGEEFDRMDDEERRGKGLA
jgi:hypothetical protein